MVSVSSQVAPETILAFPVPCPPVRHARSTILLGSMASLRAAGHFETYAAALPVEHRDVLFQTVAGVWIPVEVARAHYRAHASRSR